jgi:heptosyltransferase-2
MNIGIVLPNWIGDVVMATPALRALRERFPDARLTGIMRPYVDEVLAGTNWLDEMLLVDTKKRPRLLTTWRVGRDLRQHQFDKMVLLTNSLSTGALAWVSGARERIGFAGKGRGWMLTKRLDFPREDGRKVPRSAVDQYLEIVAAAGARSDNPHVELIATPMEIAAAQNVWRELKLQDADRVVVLNTGGAYGAAKSWPAEHFAILAKRIVRTYNAAVLVICGPAEKPAAREIVRLANEPRVVSLADWPTSIRLSKGCLAAADLVVSTDSGPRHIAAALGVPTITLFGPTDPRWSDNYQDNAITLQEPVPCGPCAKRVCPLKHHRCMVDLHVDRVFAAVEEQLGERRSKSAA